MGGASSKAARNLPKRTETPLWAGARTRLTTDHPPEGPLASEAKNDAIERDSRDPLLLSNLSRLHPVRVDHHMQAVRPAEDTDRIFRSRAQSEYEASAPNSTRNRLHATTLSHILDERKSVTSRVDLEQLANKYDVDVAKLESLSRFVSSPSINGGTVVRTVRKDGEESITMKAVWIEPHLRDSHRPEVHANP